MKQDSKPVWLVIDKSDKSVICVCLREVDANKAMNEFKNIADLHMYYSYS